MDIGGRVASGTATEKMSGSAKPALGVHIFETRMIEQLQEVGGRVTPGAVIEESLIISSALTP